MVRKPVSNLKKDFWIQTIGGLAVNFSDPKPEQFSIDDIAYALSGCRRYTGHTLFHYSVAEHSIHVANTVGWFIQHNHKLWTSDPNYGKSDGAIKLVRAGFAHDWTEAYLTDLAAPVKWYLAAQGSTHYEELEDKLNAVIFPKWGLDPALAKHPLVKLADYTMLHTEKLQMLGPSPQEWVGMPPPLPSPPMLGLNAEAANYHFLETYKRLFDA